VTTAKAEGDPVAERLPPFLLYPVPLRPGHRLIVGRTRTASVGAAMLAFAWGAAITLVFASLAIWRYRRAVAR